jgi:hypothetical protein
VANSTFPLIDRLANHSAWYYSGPGGTGVANVEPESVQGAGLEQLLASYAATVSENAESTASTELGVLSREISGAIREELPDDNPRKAMFFERLRQAARITEEIDEIGPSVRSFLEVAAFSTTFNLDWYAVSPET